MLANDVLSALGDLSSAELKKVRSMAELLLSSARSEDDVWADAAWRQLVLQAEGCGITLPSFVKSVGKYSDFCKSADRAVEYMVTRCGATDKTGTCSYLRLVGRAVLARSIELRNELGVPISPQTVMQQYASFESAMENQWPGGAIEYTFVLNR
jgi:hypothetical protein